MLKYLPFLLLLLVIAIVIRDDFAFTLIYLFAGAFAVGAWWSTKSLGQIEHSRSFIEHSFLGEKVQIKLQFRNRGWLPVPWLKIQDELPVGLSTAPSFATVTSLGPNAETTYIYELEGRKRGCYNIGPLFLSSGDILGLIEEIHIQKPMETLTIYPRIVPIKAIRIPSRSPQGSLRYHQPIFEDPARIFSKREYIPGDSLRRVDWKTTASSGKMLVKMFEPTIELESMIVLDLDPNHYPYRQQIDSTELAIVVAASLASWISAKKQEVGLIVSGRDPSTSDGQPQSLSPRKGQAHLMRILEILARAVMAEMGELAEVIQQERVRLAWGTSLIIITGQVSDPLLNELYQSRRAGLEVLVILAGRVGQIAEITQRAAHFGIPVISIANEKDLEIWQK